MNENQMQLTQTYLAKTYLALDLELNNAPDGSTPNPKIIEVGVAWGSCDDYKANTLKSRRWYIDPQEPIYPFITELTGITDADIEKYAVSHSQVAMELSELITCKNTFINPVTWGGGDSVELLQEFRDRDIIFPHFGRRWIDVKTFFIYNRLSTGTSLAGGLSKTMPKFGIHFEGEPHRASVDAYNTLRLFFCMVERQSKMEQLLKDARSFK